MRNIFDVAGLWSAVFRSYDTEGFYRQLALAQVGIERHSRLLSPTKDVYERRQDDKVDDRRLTKDKGQMEEKRVLESYYRRHFWNPMHCYNRLRLYLRHFDSTSSEDNEPRLYMVKWDIDAVAELSHYLSKRTVIGEYNFVSLDKDENDPDAKELNFICVGEGVRPLEKSLPEYIKKQMITKEGRYYSEIHKHILKQYEKECMNAKRIYKGFVSVNENNRGFFTQHPQTKCLSCSVSCEHEGRVYTSMDELDGCSCTIGTSGEHTELAQLILWRDNPDSFQGESHFRVGLIGASGPATYGLAMLFVDEEQRKKCFKGKKGGERDQYLLCELQTEIRKKFMEVFIGRLHEELEGMEFYTNQGEQLEDEQKNTYFELVEYAASLYLSSVMYRYFLPFLSENDIRRIYNGMHIFVVTMKASRMSPFSLNYAPDGDARFNSSISDEGIESVVKMIPELLRSVLQKFQGVEAFYQVGVKHSYGTGKGETTDKDTRSVQNIKMLAIQGKPAVSCIFGSGKTGEKEKS